MPNPSHRPSTVISFGLQHAPADAWTAHFPPDAWNFQRVPEWDAPITTGFVTSLRPDAVIIDAFRDLSEHLGLCAALRRVGAFPILVGVPRLERDEAAAYSAGADDVTLAPLRPPSVRVRLEALWRLSRRRNANGAEKLVRHGAWRLEPDTATATFGDRPLDLNASEFSLLLAIGRGRGKPVARGELSRELLGCDHRTGDRAIDLRVSRLGRKLRAQLGSDRLIATVRGFGYRLEAAGDGD